LERRVPVRVPQLVRGKSGTVHIPRIFAGRRLMKKTVMPISIVSCTVFLSACAIHPLPEDFSGVTTDQIVRQIRCETRQAAKDLVLDEIRLLANETKEASET
jgi:hypothetical protein